MDELAPVRETTSDGRLWALLSYGGLLMGIPLGLAPLLQRNDAYALFHAKHAMVVALEFAVAAGVWLALFVLSFALGFVTCGLSHFFTAPLVILAFSVVFLPLIPLIHGIIIAVNAEWRAPVGTFGLADVMFAKLEIEQQPDS